MLNTTIEAPRYSDSSRQKSEGATYTPEVLAQFVAGQMLRAVEFSKHGKIRVLDPAVGDGMLLAELVKQIPLTSRKRLEIVGYDTNPEAILFAQQRLRRDFPYLNLHLEQKDFLEHVLSLQSCGDLFAIGKEDEPFHLIIANPPYVRTQIMGTHQAQQLAKNFGLSGRVDLYYPFLLAISQVLASEGIAGVITSNRFMTTKSGQAVRRELLSRFQILHAWDLGDTKLFGAAVLPSVLLARGVVATQKQANNSHIAYSSIYETSDMASVEARDPLSAFAVEDNRVVALPDGRHFRVRHGTLDNAGSSEAVWRLATQATDEWLATVESNTWQTFQRIGKIRVGVKSTADKVYIRSDWDELPGGCPELVRPLITRHCARRFKANVPPNPRHIKKILYPHEVTEQGRGAVDLTFYPKAAHYLEQHRNILAARTYVIEAGRQWYELWVPQDPAAWSYPKLVFLDISDKPVFWLDMEGGIVNGECYWLRCENESEQDLLWLALAVANSTFIEAFYDHRFNNKLYAGRRRFITQYVEQFPLPDPNREASKTIIALTKEIYSKLPSVDADKLALELDERVWRVFGVSREKVTR